MRHLCLLTGILLLTSSAAPGADKPSFPYEAIVDVDNGEDVWSGPDAKKFYPTIRLKKGERVKVHRHDLHGWCMIAPPKGSYSWVRDVNVRKDTGAILVNRAAVHVGSQLNPEDFTTLQGELHKGESVEILGEKTFLVEGEGPRTMLKIPPQKGEWRWIKRTSIVPVDSIHAAPFSDEAPSRRRNGPVADADTDDLTRPISTGTTLSEDRRTPAHTGDVNASPEAIEQRSNKQRLSEIDQQFREMVKQDPPTWDLDSIEQQYQQLIDDTDQPILTNDIGRRMDSIKRHRKMQQDYVDFFKLASETKERDSQLMALQNQGQSPTVRQIPDNTPTSPQAAPAAPTGPPSGTAPSFDGAGIVRRLATSYPGGPQYVLVSPDERVLAVLQPNPGVDLSRYNGRAMGIIGQRFHRPEWNADVINVRGLQPVQLRTNKTP